MIVLPLAAVLDNLGAEKNLCPLMVDNSFYGSDRALRDRQ